LHVFVAKRCVFALIADSTWVHGAQYVYAQLPLIADCRLPTDIFEPASERYVENIMIRGRPGQVHQMTEAEYMSLKVEGL